MRFISYKFTGQEGVATQSSTRRWLGQLLKASGHPGSIDALIAGDRSALEGAHRDLLARGGAVEIGQVELLPPLCAERASMRWRYNHGVKPSDSAHVCRQVVSKR